MDSTAPTSSTVDLSTLLISLLKTVLYREDNERLWASLLRLQTRVREYASILNLELVLDEAEGYAFFKGRPGSEPAEQAPYLPRLVVRRQLSYPVSLLLALLRKKLTEFDASGGDTRLMINRDQIVEMMRVFLAETPNEAKLVDQIDAHINKVVVLGFLRKLKPTFDDGLAEAPTYEVRRILKAFVDAQWLSDLDNRLESYLVYAKSGERELADE